MAYSWENRIKFIVRHMYDVDHSGSLDKRDFDCLAVRNTIIEGKGSWSEERYSSNKKVMEDLWEQIAELADFNKDGEVSVDEFKRGIESSCKGKTYDEFPEAFKFFIDSSFRTTDINGDGCIGLEEYRFSCVSRSAYESVEQIDKAFHNLLNDSDRANGGLTLSRYQELYAQFVANEDENQSANLLFGPLTEMQD